MWLWLPFHSTTIKSKEVDHNYNYTFIYIRLSVCNIEKRTEICLFWSEAHGWDDELFVVCLWFAVCDTRASHLTRDLIPCLWCAAAKPLLWVYIGVAAAAVFVLLIIVCIVCRCVAKRRSKPGKQRPRNEQTISGSKILKTWCQVTASACCAINFYNSSEPKNIEQPWVSHLLKGFHITDSVAHYVYNILYNITLCKKPSGGFSSGSK